jgi:Amt family ammonium transporter
VHWVVFGYSFAFGPGTKGYGNFDWVGLRHVGQTPNSDYAPTVPHLVYMVYQMMFAIITPVCTEGAGGVKAERALQKNWPNI